MSANPYRGSTYRCSRRLVRAEHWNDLPCEDLAGHAGPCTFGDIAIWGPDGAKYYVVDGPRGVGFLPWLRRQILSWVFL